MFILLVIWWSLVKASKVSDLLRPLSEVLGWVRSITVMVFIVIFYIWNFPLPGMELVTLWLGLIC